MVFSESESLPSEHELYESAWVPIGQLELFQLLVGEGFSRREALKMVNKIRPPHNQIQADYGLDVCKCVACHELFLRHIVHEARVVEFTLQAQLEQQREMLPVYTQEAYDAWTHFEGYTADMLQENVLNLPVDFKSRCEIRNEILEELSNAEREEYMKDMELENEERQAQREAAIESWFDYEIDTRSTRLLNVVAWFVEQEREVNTPDLPEEVTILESLQAMLGRAGSRHQSRISCFRDRLIGDGNFNIMLADFDAELNKLEEKWA
jgi:hypothetical protein